MRRFWLLIVCAGCRYTAPGDTPDAPVIDAPEIGMDGSDAPIAWLHPWQHRKSITLHGGQIEAPSGGALANFPVAIAVTDAAIRGGVLAGGKDIVFTTADATTLLASEVESLAGDELVAWVKVPSLPAGIDSTLYVYYGNASPPDQTPEAVWTEYLGVWHMQQDPGPGGNGDILDSTSANHDGTVNANMQPQNLVAAQVGRGILFDGIEDFANFGAINLGNSFTISMWARYDGGASCNALFANSGSGRDIDGIKFFVNSVSSNDHRLVIETGKGPAGSGQIAETADNAVPIATFTHLAAVIDRTGAIAKLFVDGQSVATDETIINNFKVDSDFEFGRMENTIFFFGGVLDEIEIASTQRPVEWLRTTVHNQLQPGSFFTLGAEESEP